MKIIAIILSLYFLALNALPCNDIVTDVDSPRTEVAASVDWDHDHSTSDLCPPFCGCHCCHVHTIDFGVAAFIPLQPTISQENYSHFDSLGKDIAHSLLQPPRA